MRAALLAALLLVGCNVPGTISESVGDSIRTGVTTVGDEHVLTGIERIGTSPHMRAILQQLTRDLLDTAAGAARGPEVEASLRALIACAIDEIRHDLSDVPGELGAAIDAQLDDLMLTAEAMIGRVVRRAMHDARAMIDGDDISAWISDLVQEVLGDMLTLADERLPPDSAERLGGWMRRALGELLRDVDLEQSTERIAAAAARGFSQGLASELRNDAGLGGALREETRQLGASFREASADAARPWMIVVGMLAIVIGVVAYLYYRTHREHTTLRESLERDENRSAREVMDEARSKGVRVAARRTLPPPDGPSE